MFSWLQTLFKLSNMHDTLFPAPDSTLRAVREALSASVSLHSNPHPLSPLPTDPSTLWMERQRKYVFGHKGKKLDLFCKRCDPI